MTLPAEALIVPLGTPNSARALRALAGGAPRTDDVGIDPGDASSYRAFLEALGVAVYTTDADGRITFFNDAAVAFWGRRPELGEEWCGSLRLFHVDGTPLPHDQCPMATALTERRAVRGSEAIAERPDGSRVSFTPYPTPLFDDAGELIGAVNVLIDVTERRVTEDALRARDRALSASNAVRDEFLGLVSHELRTPVTTILGNAALLESRGDRIAPDVRAGMIADIAADAGRLQAIVENLLHLTRLESGIEPDLEPQVVQRLVSRSVTAFRRRAPARVIRSEMPSGALLVSAEATYFELLVDNLLSNADKYSPPDQSIDVEVMEDGDDVRIVVRDRGIGFDQENAAALFEPFYRTSGARATATGLGIGLALCHRIAVVLHGRITASPRDGGGAEFAVMLARLEDQHGR